MGNSERRRAREIFNAGVAAADPQSAVRRSLEQAGLPPVLGRLFVVAVGKAAMGMASAALNQITAAETLIVTNYENAADFDGATVHAAGHPVPDENGLAAGRAVRRLLETAGPDDHILALISGGGSALLPAPVDGLSLADKAHVNRLLLGAGMDITAMNMVRQHLSRLKGGGFLRLAQPATVTALILSDVVGDDLRVVASGPTVAPIGSRADASKALKSAGIWDELPSAAQAALTALDAAPPDTSRVDNRLIGSNAISVAAMAAVAPGAQTYAHPLEGDVQDAAEIIAATRHSSTCLFGGETTVRLTGDGLGGRNQELALRVALLAEQQGWPTGWVFLSGGTDGRDGPCDAAGGLVDAGTLDRMRAAGIDPDQILANNDSYHALQAAGDLLMTGATGTNVADLQVLIRP